VFADARDEPRFSALIFAWTVKTTIGRVDAIVNCPTASFSSLQTPMLELKVKSCFFFYLVGGGSLSQ
jgi:hypothetical protein